MKFIHTLIHESQKSASRVHFWILHGFIHDHVRSKIEAGLIFGNPLYNSKNAFLHAAAYIYYLLTNKYIPQGF